MRPRKPIQVIILVCIALCILCASAYRSSIRTIVIHHSASIDSPFVLNTREIRNEHIKIRNYNNIGYHFVIENYQNNYEIVCGRQLGSVGAHCKGHNAHSLGVCLVGNFETTGVPDRQWQQAVELVASLCIVFKLPATSIYGHYELASTKCPGKNFDLEKFRGQVRAVLSATPSD